MNSVRNFILRHQFDSFTFLRVHPLTLRTKASRSLYSGAPPEIESQYGPVSILYKQFIYDKVIQIYHDFQ